MQTLNVLPVNVNVFSWVSNFFIKDANVQGINVIIQEGNYAIPMPFKRFKAFKAFAMFIT